MISEFLRKFPVRDPSDVDGIDYGEIRQIGEFFFPYHDEQRHFSEKNCYRVGDDYYTYGEDWHPPIDGVGYKVNNYGFHGSDFVSNPDLLCAGCSVTVGFALPHLETWPHILREHRFNIDTVNVVGEPGASIAKIVYMVFSHVDRFGWPKEIHLCLPDIHRGWEQVRRGSGKLEETAVWYDPNTAEYFTHSAKKSPFRVESPDGTKKALPMPVVVRENMMALDMLSMVCWSSGIPLVISTYAQSTHRTLGSAERLYPGYRPLHRSLLNGISTQVGHPTDCCDATWQDFCTREETWAFALDGVHPGHHAHIHLAEAHLGDKIV